MVYERGAATRHMSVRAGGAVAPALLMNARSRLDAVLAAGMARMSLQTVAVVPTDAPKRNRQDAGANDLDVLLDTEDGEIPDDLLDAFLESAHEQERELEAPTVPNGIGKELQALMSETEPRNVFLSTFVGEAKRLKELLVDELLKQEAAAEEAGVAMTKKEIVQRVYLIVDTIRRLFPRLKDVTTRSMRSKTFEYRLKHTDRAIRPNNQQKKHQQHAPLRSKDVEDALAALDAALDADARSTTTEQDPPPLEVHGAVQQQEDEEEVEEERAGEDGANALVDGFAAKVSNADHALLPLKPGTDPTTLPPWVPVVLPTRMPILLEEDKGKVFTNVDRGHFTLGETRYLIWLP